MQIFKTVIEISFQWLIRVVTRCVEFDFDIFKSPRQFMLFFSTFGNIILPEAQAVISAAVFTKKLSSNLSSNLVLKY